MQQAHAGLDFATYGDRNHLFWSWLSSYESFRRALAKPCTCEPRVGVYDMTHESDASLPGVETSAKRMACQAGPL